MDCMGEHTLFEVNKPVSNCVCLFWCMHRTISFADDELMIIIMIMYRCIHVLIEAVFFLKFC